MTELEAFEAMYGKSYLRTKKPREYAIAWEAWQAATKAEREACCKAIDAIDDGEAPEYRACQEAIRARSNAPGNKPPILGRLINDDACGRSC